jgi:cell wall-associated NlpC family hydrolase
LRRAAWTGALIAAWLITGCTAHELSVGSIPSYSPRKIKIAVHRGQVKKVLNRHYAAWKGVPYCYGGLSKAGVDCSGFIYLAFRQKLGLVLPRSTQALAKRGKKISRRKLASGDLVFFKTGWSQRHVGIYLDDDQFLHASTSKGVTRSSLRDSYWSEHFWQARRVLR